MSVKILDANFDKNIFNKHAVHPLQSWQWGETRITMGSKVIRLGEYDGEQLVQTFQFTIHDIPKTPFKVGYLPRSAWPSKNVFTFMQQYAKDNKIVFYKIEPNIYTHHRPDEQGNFKPDAELAVETYNLPINKSPHPLFPKWSQRLDLRPSEEELLKNMKPKTRYNIRVSEKKGVIVKEESNEQGYEVFAKLFFETCKRQKYLNHNEYYHKTVWNHLKDGIAHILIAYYQDIPLASYELFYFNNVLYYPYGGSSIEHKNVMAPNSIMWEAIRLGKKLGAEDFEMWGSLPPNYDKDDKWAGFTRFKEGYGAVFTEMIGSYDFVINPFIYKLYGIAHILRKKLLAMRN